MLYTYSITAQTVAADANLNFNINGVLTGCTVSHSAGTPSIQLKRPGYYMVHFNASAAATATGDVTVHLQDDEIKCGKKAGNS